MKDILLLVILIVFVWTGMILGISFLEAPLKFKAPNVTLPIGLGIGRLVFTALNRIEILFCLCTLVMMAFLRPPLNIWIIASAISFILLIQSLWLLPVLDQRAEIIISGGVPTQKSLHIYYVIAEAVKMISLITLGCMLVRDILRNNQSFYS
jgi:hypothetical protein